MVIIIRPLAAVWRKIQRRLMEALDFVQFLQTAVNPMIDRQPVRFREVSTMKNLQAAAGLYEQDPRQPVDHGSYRRIYVNVA